jgi:hypothetical protein
MPFLSTMITNHVFVLTTFTITTTTCTTMLLLLYTNILQLLNTFLNCTHNHRQMALLTKVCKLRSILPVRLTIAKITITTTIVITIIYTSTVETTTLVTTMINTIIPTFTSKRYNTVATTSIIDGFTKGSRSLYHNLFTYMGGQP